MDDATHHLLLIEDDIGQVRLLLRTLKSSGGRDFLVTHAPSLKKALGVLSVTPIDVVLLDLNLPDSTGMKTFEAIAAYHHDVPVVILSGTADAAMAMESVKSGAQDYLVKGLDGGTTIVRSLRYAIERKRNEREMKRLQDIVSQERRLEALGVLASGIAHEINTPTQFVGANLQFLEKAFQRLEDVLDTCDRLVDAATRQEGVAAAVEAMQESLKENRYTYLRHELTQSIVESLDGVRRIRTIVSAMNAFSRTPEEKWVDYDVNRAIRDAVTVSRNEWKHVAQVKLELDERLPCVPCHPEELCQALLNLIINAVQAIGGHGNGSRQRGAIVINTCKTEDAVEIHVADTGTGIPQDIQHRIFEPFFTTKAIGEGSGQGLALVYSVIVKKHGGDVSFRSDEGQGTVFTLALPLHRDAALDVEEPAGRPA